VKAMIYKCVFQDSRDGKTPALLIALRSRHEKYKDALRIYYRVTMVNLGGGKKKGILRKMAILWERSK
jgi:hypothetical protein